MPPLFLQGSIRKEEGRFTRVPQEHGMTDSNTKTQIQHRIRHVIALGKDPGDGHLRVTRGDQFDILMGDDESHQALTELCLRMDRFLRERDLRLEELTEKEFIRLMLQCSAPSGEAI